MQLKPETGRSHQLRVHMLSLGYPIIGDPFYAEGEALAASDRLELHATELQWWCPGSGETRKVTISGP
jgi:tRNA pseudouridine32 synthase/23S rRNA pseudouridine746 synthase